MAEEGGRNLRHCEPRGDEDVAEGSWRGCCGGDVELRKGEAEGRAVPTPLWAYRTALEGGESDVRGC